MKDSRLRTTIVLFWFYFKKHFRTIATTRQYVEKWSWKSFSYKLGFYSFLAFVGAVAVVNDGIQYNPNPVGSGRVIFLCLGIMATMLFGIYGTIPILLATKDTCGSSGSIKSGRKCDDGK